MKEVTKYPDYTFSWIDLATPDPEAGKRFYCGLFGWEYKDEPVDDTGVYTMLSLHGKSVAGLSSMPPSEKDSTHGYWTSYATTYDIEATLNRVAGLGGTVIAPAFDVMDAGRMALIKDPTGAMSAMWEPKNHIGSSLVNQFNTFSWNELLTTDRQAAALFYEGLYGWKSEYDENSGYTSFTNNGRAAAGMLQITEDMGPAPSNWMVYFMVDDVDAYAAKAADLGGGMMMPAFDAPRVGRIAMLHDPQRIPFYVIQFAGTVDDPPQG